MQKKSTIKTQAKIQSWRLGFAAKSAVSVAAVSLALSSAIAADQEFKGKVRVDIYKAIGGTATGWS